jgi:hypothetical protein
MRRGDDEQSLIVLTVVDDSGDSLTGVRAISTIKFIAITASIVTSLACGGLFMDKDSLIKRNVFVLNVATGAGLVGSVINDGTLTPIPGPSNVPFGEISGEMEVLSSEYDISVRVGGMTSPYVSNSVLTRSALTNLVVAMCPASGPTCEILPILPTSLPVLVFYKDGLIQGATSVDIYVTAPGASIASVAPDGTMTSNGVGHKLPLALHANTDYQVRLTSAGTKTVVYDSGTRTGIAGTDYTVFTFYHNGTTEAWKSVTLRSTSGGF